MPRFISLELDMWTRVIGVKITWLKVIRPEVPGSSRLRRLKHSCHFPATWSRSGSVAINFEASGYAEVGRMSPTRRRRRRERSKLEARLKMRR
jgi:hypothetical protein